MVGPRAGGLCEGAAGWKLGLFLRMQSIGTEDPLNFDEFGFIGGVARAAKPMGPVLVGGKFLAPTGEIETDCALMMLVPEAMMCQVSGVGWGAGIVVKMGLFDRTGGGRTLFDVQDRSPILAGGLDVFAMKMIPPHMSIDAHGLVYATSVGGL